ncbi:cyclic nucleotide-binding domain-containing protein [Thermocoleostomius sinensis]|uniref:GNAT family N-acetyltransferase n=1 Tax=Thermocoleostomius sinensis A174 TaxID=2016057 RepID=A0A9E8ZDU4_9CYAN|nr:cyclic nucleotide-binding domain-containing protein [Thermocoleostomius sinensis]WAL61495.1 GNAT family N-acetyltransferase [Thermocoleostomius sinensis A174]
MAQVLLATTPEARQQIYQFRYRVYVEEMNKNPRGANHAERILKDELDDTATLLYLTIDGDIAATLRRNRLSETPLPNLIHRALEIERFMVAFPKDVLSFSSRFMVAPKYRNSSIAGAIVVEAYKLAREQGILFDFSHASPWLVPFYENLGFRRYGDNFLDVDAGLQIPLVLLLDDIAHLQAVHSPMYRSARRVTTPTVTRDWFLEAFPKAADFFNTYQHSPEEVWEFWLHKQQNHSDQPVSIFQSLDREQLKKLLRQGLFHSVKAGENIVRIGDIHSSVFVVLSGIVQRQSTIHSNTTTTSVLNPHHFFGEVTLFASLPSPEQVTAVTDVELFVLPKQAAMRAIKTMPDAMCQFFLQVSQSLCERYVAKDVTYERSTDLSSSNINQAA